MAHFTDKNLSSVLETVATKMENLGQQYQQGFDHNVYLENYSRAGLAEIDCFFTTHLFQAFQQGKMRGPRCIDIGAGPMMHRLATASRFCDVVVHSDFTDTNRDAARLWLTTEQLDHKYRHFTKFIAGLEGHRNDEEGAKIIEKRLRSKCNLTVPIDILQNAPVGDLSDIGGPFDCAFSSACIDSVCFEHGEYVQAAKNIGSLLKQGAAFALMGFLNGTYYKAAGAKLPCFNWDADMVERGLAEAGYNVDFIDVIDAPPDKYSKNPDDILSDCDSVFFCLSYKN